LHMVVAAVATHVSIVRISINAPTLVSIKYIAANILISAGIKNINTMCTFKD
jgi:hypothetical protein